MFGRKLRVRLNEIQMELNALQSKVSQVNQHTSFDCETCGCMISKDKAIAGEDQVWTRIEYNVYLPNGGWMPQREVKFIHTPYYCKKCAPKEKKENGHD